MFTGITAMHDPSAVQPLQTSQQPLSKYLDALLLAWNMTASSFSVKRQTQHEAGSLRQPGSSARSGKSGGRAPACLDACDCTADEL